VECPNCGGVTSVTETRAVGRFELRRRRSCAACKLRFTTREQIAAPQLKVEKRRGGAEPYERAKLRTSLIRVCDHRPVAEQAIDDMVEWIEARLTRPQVRTVRWSQIVEVVLLALAGVDRVAEQRMASNYRDDDGVLRFDETPAAAPRPQLGLFPEAE